MLDLLPPEEMTLSEAGESLRMHLQVTERGVRDADRIYYDTFDGLLHAEGSTCVHEDGRLVLTERGNGAEIAAIARQPPTNPMTASEFEPGTFRDALQKLIGVRALLPLAHVHARERSLGLLDDAEKTVVRITLEEPALVSSSSVHRALRPRVRLAPVRGYDDELCTATRTLVRELGFKPADQPLVDEAVRAAGRPPAGVTSKPEIALDRGQRSDAAAALVLLRLLDVIEANIDGTLADIDSEFLHDFRVAVRRSRSVQREFKRVFPPARLQHFRDEFRWLQQVSGDARDLDVYVLEFDEYRALIPESIRPDLDPLLGVLRNRRLIARRDLSRALRSERAEALPGQWRTFLEELPATALTERPYAQRPVAELAAERISKVYRRMLKMGRAIDASSPAAEYHELRKKGKELRYLLELFGTPLYPSEVVKPAIKSLKALQDVLGRHQDREVQVAMLRSLRDEVAALPGGPAALMAMGVLVQRLADDELAARREFVGQFEAFASKSQRRVMKGTFG